MNKISTLLLLLGLLLLQACGDPKPVTDALHRAEACMNEHPDSALTLLKSVSPDEMGQNSTRALYALLYTQAQDKNYIDETNDSLISVAVDYYRDTDDMRHKFLSYYYKGRVHANAKDHIQAMLSFLEAEKLSTEVNDGYLCGLLYTQMGDIYKNYFDYSKSLAMFQKAAICYEQAGKDLHRLYALVDQVSIYKNLGENEEGYRLLYVVLKEGKQKKYHGLVQLCLGDLVMLCVDMKKFDEADELFHELKQKFDLSGMSSSFMANVAEIQAVKKDWELSQELLEQAWLRANTERDTIVLHFAESHIHEMRHPQSKAYYSMLEGVKKQSLLVRKNMEQPLLSAQNNLLSMELEYQQYKLRVERIRRSVVLILVVSLSVAIIYWGQKWLRKLYRKRMRERLQQKEDSHKLVLDGLLKQMAEKDENICSLISEFNQKMDAKDMNFRRVLVDLENELASKNGLCAEYIQQTDILQKEKDRYSAYFNQLFGERMEFMDNLLHVLNTDYATDKLRDKALGEAVDAFIKKITGTKKAYTQLEELVNATHDHVMNRLRSEVKLPDEDSYRQACYHFAGYSVFSIAVLMGDTKNKIYKRRDRIRKKIEDLSPKSIDLFKNIFDK